MLIDRTEKGVTTIHDRPLFVPLFCLLFVVIGFQQLIEHTSRWDWDTESAWGVTLTTLLGGSGFVYTARRSSYRFDTARAALAWRRWTLFGVREGTLPFADIDRVYVHRGPDPDDTTFRVILFTTDGVFPLNHGYTCGEEGLRQVAEAVEEAITRPRKAG